MTTPAYHASGSAEQQHAEHDVLLCAGARYSVILERSRRRLGTDVAFAAVDGATDNLSVLVECFARQAALKPVQVHEVATDLQKLVTIRGPHPEARLDPVAAHPAVQARLHTGWLGEAGKQWTVDVLEVVIDEAPRRQLVAAQTQQAMMNTVVSGDAGVEP